MKYVLAINPGSTTTKVALFEQERKIWQSALAHSLNDLKKYRTVWDQLPLRLQVIRELLSDKRVNPVDFAAIVGRGGLLRPIRAGTYLVNQSMLEDAERGIQGEHAANIGCVLAYHIAREADVEAYVVDPISVDEFEALARYSGHPLIERRCLSHSLNIHVAIRTVAARLNLNYERVHFVAAHLGSGITIAAVRGGMIIDVNDASSDGPFSPERSGGLPLQPFIKLCFSGKYSEADMRRLVMGQGGLSAYFGTSSAQEVEEEIQIGNKAALEIYQAMAYQIAKEIAAMAAVLYGNVQAIVLTGGLAKSKILTDWIRERTGFIAEVVILPGEFEMEAMNAGVLRVLKGLERAKTYP